MVESVGPVTLGGSGVGVFAFRSVELSEQTSGPRARVAGQAMAQVSAPIVKVN
jgi:hypothetical protein